MQAYASWNRHGPRERKVRALAGEPMNQMACLFIPSHRSRLFSPFADIFPILNYPDGMVTKFHTPVIS
jgi:hypothetical protein